MRNFWKGLLGILIVLLFNFEQVMAYNGGNNPAPGKPRANSRYVPYSPPESYPQILKRYNKQLIEVAGQIDPGLISKMQIKPEELVARTVFGGDFPVMEDGSFVVKVVEGVRQDVIFLNRKTGRLVLLGHFLPQNQFLWVDARSSLLSLTAILMPRVYPKLLSNWEALQKGGEILEEKLAQAHSLSELIRERVNTGLMVQGSNEIWPSEIELTVVSSDEVGGTIKLVNKVPCWFYADSGREERMLPRAKWDVLKSAKDFLKSILKTFFGSDLEEEGDWLKEYGKIKLKVRRDSQSKAKVNVYNPLPLEISGTPLAWLTLKDYLSRLNNLSFDEKVKVFKAGLVSSADMVLTFILTIALNSTGEHTKELGKRVFKELKEGLGENIIEKTSEKLFTLFAPDNPVKDAIAHPDMVLDAIKDAAMDIGVDLLVDLILALTGFSLLVALVNFIFTYLNMVWDAIFNETFQYPKWTKSIIINENLDDGLIAYWPMDGSAVDMTENRCDGIVHGAIPTSDRHGFPQSAYYFDGHSWIEFSSRCLNNLPEGTVSLWVSLDKLNTRHALLDKTITNYVNAFQLLVTQDNRVHISIGAYYGSLWGYYSRAHLTKNKWYHIAVTWNGRQWRLYINGRLDSTFDDDRTVPLENGIMVFIGKSDENGWDPFSPDYLKGKIDEVRIYKKALSDKDILDLYQSK